VKENSLPSSQQRIAGWGNHASESCVLFRPERARELSLFLQSHSAEWIARGNGRSYGDAAQQSTGTLLTTRYDHLVSWDEVKSAVTAQPGITLAELQSIFVPRGWSLPVIPGTSKATLGGAVAADVHGKNQFRKGNFCNHVLALEIVLPNGEHVTCTREIHPELFTATCGGMGMTGLILSVTVQMVPITSSSLRTEVHEIEAVEQMVIEMRNHSSQWEYMVGWMDHFVTGNSAGKGYLQLGKHIGTEEGGAVLTAYSHTPSRRNIPLLAPRFLLNNFLMRRYNRRRLKHMVESDDTITSMPHFWWPLDDIDNWNRLYGERGFLQLQCLLPDTPNIIPQLRALLNHFQYHKLYSYLAVIKYHKLGSPGMMAFHGEGFSLAMDFPVSKKLLKALPEYFRKISEYGGRIYLAKDATLPRDAFEQMYGNVLPMWRDALKQADPDARIASGMSARLGFKPWKGAAHE